MAVQTGNWLPPARLNPAAFQLQLASDYTLTATNTSLALTNVTPGYSGSSFTVPDGGMVGLAVWTAYFNLVTAGTITFATVDLTIDNSLPTSGPVAVWNPSNVAAGARITASQSWPFALTAGTHSFGLRAAVTLTSGSVRLMASHTTLSILLHP